MSTDCASVTYRLKPLTNHQRYALQKGLWSHTRLSSPGIMYLMIIYLMMSFSNAHHIPTVALRIKYALLDSNHLCLLLSNSVGMAEASRLTSLSSQTSSTWLKAKTSICNLTKINKMGLNKPIRFKIESSLVLIHAHARCTCKPCG